MATSSTIALARKVATELENFPNVRYTTFISKPNGVCIYITRGNNGPREPQNFNVGYVFLTDNGEIHGEGLTREHATWLQYAQEALANVHACEAFGDWDCA